MITKQERINISKLIESKAIATSHLTQAADGIKESAAIAYVRASDALEAYLDSLVAPKDTTATNDGWIEWNGGECPVPEGTRTEVRFKGRDKAVDNYPEDWNWEKIDSDGCIIAYRIVSE